MNLENHIASTMNLSNNKLNPASSSSSSPRNSEIKNSVPISQDFPSLDSQAPITSPFLGFSTSGNGWECPYSEIYPIIVPQNEDDYCADNALMDMFKDILLIEQIRSQENTQKKHQESGTQQVTMNNGSIGSEKFTKRTLNYDNNHSQIQIAPTLNEVFGHSQRFNHQLSSPANKRQRTSSENRCNSPHLVSNNNFNVNQEISSSVKPTRGSKCIKTSCSNGPCPCFQAKVGYSGKTRGCQGSHNSPSKRNGRNFSCK